MIRKLFSLSIPLFVSGAWIGLAFLAPPAVLAVEETPDPASRCLTCHENLYFLHDRGQWCCFCEKERTCTCCHGGNPDTMDEDLAHEDMVANPLASGSEVCQDCHPEDFAERVHRFSLAAGIDLTSPVSPTRTPHAPVIAGSTGAERPSTPLLELQPLPPWQIAAFSLLGAAFLATLIFGYRCWKADCLPKPF
jgi:hypothetical protein